MTVDELARGVKAIWSCATAFEPARGKPNASDVAQLRQMIEPAQAALSELPADADNRADLAQALANALARSAVVALAAGDAETARAWLAAAQRTSTDAKVAAIFAAGLEAPERYRLLVHGRYAIAHGHERQARKLWTQVARDAKANDLLADAADAEQRAPRPITGKLPTLHRINGIGAAFYGARDHEPDGTYVTTHCISALWIPIFPLGAYRVRKTGAGSYSVMAREQLSKLARLARIVMPAVLALAVGGFATHHYLTDPARQARQQFADAIDQADSGTPDAALARLDAELSGTDLPVVSHVVAQRAGAAVVRLTAGYVPTPFTSGDVDQANRVVRRYIDLPDAAKGGVALDALFVALDGWLATLTATGDAEARLALLSLEASVADPGRMSKVNERASAERIAVASAKAADWPLEALALLVEQAGDTAALAKAAPIVHELSRSPALLEDAGPDLDAYLATLPAEDAERKRLGDLRDAAHASHVAADANGQTATSLGLLAVQHPDDQRIAVALARRELDAGKLDAADARLRKLGTPGWLVRDARLVLAKVAIGRDKLDVADDLLSKLLASRLQRFVAAGGELEVAVTAAQRRVDSSLRTGSVPADLRQRVDAASEAERKEIVTTWAREQIEADPAVLAKREAYLSYSDVVPTSIAAGTVKLRRAQRASGAARDALLADAEKAFLAVRTQAEGQPQYELGLGEIYARLGKTKESDAAFQSVLDKKVPELTLAVAGVYREIGGVTRAKQIASDLYASAPKDIQDHTAVLLALLATMGNTDDDAEAESWFRKADQQEPFVKTALMEIEGRRLLRAGKAADCERKFAETARLYLQTASAANIAGYNNAAIADKERFLCTGDVAALADAETAQAEAYRIASDEPIVVGNYAALLQDDAILRVVAKQVDVRALRLDEAESTKVLELLADSDQRDAVLAGLAADAGWRRAPELFEHEEVLAPNGTTPYGEEMWRAELMRDPAAAAAVLDRVHHAKALDTSAADDTWKRWSAGGNDAPFEHQIEATRTRTEAALARAGLDAHTRATALALHAEASSELASLHGDVAGIAAARTELLDASRLWPVLREDRVIAGKTIDEIAFGLDAARWRPLRHDRAATAVLAQLVDAGDPLAAKIRGSARWPEVVALVQSDGRRPDLAGLRLARLAGDAAAEARAKPVLDDPLARAHLELDVIRAPANPVLREDLAYLTKR